MGVFDNLKTRLEEKKTERIRQKDDKKKIKASIQYSKDKKTKELIDNEIGYAIDGHRPQSIQSTELLKEMRSVQKRIKDYKQGVNSLYEEDLFVETLVENEKEARKAKGTYNSYQTLNKTLSDRVKIESVNPSHSMNKAKINRMLVSKKEYEHMYNRPLGSMIYNYPTTFLQKDGNCPTTLLFDTKNIFKEDFINSVSNNPKYLKACSIFDLKCLMAYADGEVLAKISGGIRESLNDKYEIVTEMTKNSEKNLDQKNRQKAEINTMIGYIDVIENGAKEFVYENVKD